MSRKWINLVYFILSVLMILLIPQFAMADTRGMDSLKKSMAYIGVLNYSIPVMKVTSFDNEDFSELDPAMNIAVLNDVKTIVKNPMLILSGVISYLPKPNYYTSSNNTISPFKLDASEVSTADANKANDNSQGTTADTKDSAFDPSLKFPSKPVKPQVLIYHTHTCEGYAPGPASNMDQSNNVCAVGDEIQKSLEEYNINVIHDKTIHDAVAYTHAYDRSRETLTKYLNKYGDFDLILDVHRDSIDDKNVVTSKINGENVTNFRFVMTDANPHYSKNIQMVNKILDISNSLYPGFTRGTYAYHVGINYYSQDMSNNAALMEVGSYVSNINEAKASGKYIARILAKYLKTK